MLRGLYTAASGMVSQQRRHDTVTNNISNANTPGFKQVNTVSRSFPEMLLSLTGTATENKRNLGVMHSGVFAEESLSVHLQGDMDATGKASDFALSSDIQVPGLAFDASGKYVAPDGQITFQPQTFFTVQDRNGEIRYTRDGKFSLDDQGFMVTGDGSFVLGTDNAPIQLAPDTTIDQLVLTRDQRLINRADGADTGAQLLITLVNNPNDLVREGNSKFRLVGEQGDIRPVEAGDRFEVRQGYVERSNVDPTVAMVELMAAQRAYEANQRIVQFYDRSMEKAVNEIGRV